MSLQVTRGLIGVEDINFGTGTFTRTTSTGGSQTLNKVGAPDVPVEDAGGYYTGDDVEEVLQELGANIGSRTYTEENYVAAGETLTSSIDAIDVALGDMGKLASTSEMETGTDTTKAVPVGRLHSHPLVAKAYVVFDGTGPAGDPCTIYNSYNVSSVHKDAQGVYKITWSTPFSDANYAILVTAMRYGYCLVDYANRPGEDPTTTTCRVLTMDTGGDLMNPDKVYVVAFGDQ